MAGIPNKANIGEGVRGVSTADIKTGAVTTAKVGALAVTTGKLGAGAVTTAKLGSLAVTTGKLGAGSVTTAKLGSLAVTTGKIGTGAATKAKIAASMFRKAVRTGVAPNTAITITSIGVGDTICDVHKVRRAAGTSYNIAAVTTITSANTILITTTTTGSNVHVTWQDRT